MIPTVPKKVAPSPVLSIIIINCWFRGCGRKQISGSGKPEQKLNYVKSGGHCVYSQIMRYDANSLRRSPNDLKKIYVRELKKK